MSDIPDVFLDRGGDIQHAFEHGGEPTGFLDKNGVEIRIGDAVYVEEYPDAHYEDTVVDQDGEEFIYHGGGYSYEGIVGWGYYRGEKYAVVYYIDLWAEEGISLGCFPQEGREITGHYFNDT